MKLFTSRKKVTRHHITIRKDRYGRCDDTWCEQKLYRQLMLHGKVVFQWEIDHEIVPVYAWTGSACFGDTCGWVSKFAPFDEYGVCK
jgi:hypothetical protein